MDSETTEAGEVIGNDVEKGPISKALKVHWSLG